MTRVDNEESLVRWFLWGWNLLCLAAFLFPVADAQIEMARTFGTHGVVGYYSRDPVDRVDVLRIDRTPSFDHHPPPLISWHQYGVRWHGSLSVAAAGNYRLTLESGKAAFLSLSVDGVSASGEMDAATGETRLGLGPLFLQAVPHDIIIQRWSEGDRPLLLRMGKDGEALTPVDPEAFQFSGDEAEKVREYQRSRGGSELLGKLLWKAMSRKKPA